MPESVERAKRIDLSFPVCFVEDGHENPGHCLNISESGLMANFDHEPDLWATGSLSLSFAKSEVVLPARVARCIDHQAGMVFLFESESQRASIRALVESAAAQSSLAGGVAPF